MMTMMMTQPYVRHFESKTAVIYNCYHQQTQELVMGVFGLTMLPMRHNYQKINM